MLTTLQLRRGSQPVRPAVAWYLSSHRAVDWLREILRWETLHECVCLNPIPASHSSRQAIGALVTAEIAEDACRTIRGVPYGVESERLYLPVDAVLEPPLTDQELRDLLDDEKTYVWHPTVGLVALDPSDVMRMEDLLIVPLDDAISWDRADPGITFARRLTRMTPEAAATANDVLADGRDGIGERVNDLHDLPRSPGEPSNDPWSRAKSKGNSLVAWILRAMTSQLPSTSASPTWVNALENWANQQLAEYRERLEAKRFKEIARLLHLLETDPDQGLQYALALGNFNSRGIAPPSSELPRNDVDFDLSRLGGGFPADYWDLPSEYYFLLRTRYHQLATREIQLGRHRRAAYILAELLGDLEGAAGALRAGKYFREAAVLYRDRLRRPFDAAECLIEGGMLTEAIELFDELGEHERVGDLWTRLNRVEEAEEAYRRAIAKHRENGDFLSAARLCEVKLGSPDKALGELARGWPNSPQCLPCLENTFEILGRMGRHESSREWIEQLREGEHLPSRATRLAILLSDLATFYPDRTTKNLAADATRSLAARHIRSAKWGDVSSLLSAVERLVPEDRLLSRDCHRFQDQLAQPPSPAPSSPDRRRPTGAAAGKVHLVFSATLDSTVNWQAGAVLGEATYAVGFREETLIAGRYDWAERVKEYSRLARFEPRHTWSPILLMSGPGGFEHLLVHVLGTNPIPPRKIFEPTRDLSLPIVMGGPRGLTPYAIAATVVPGSAFTWLIEVRPEGRTLVLLGPQGDIASLSELPPPDSIEDGGLDAVALHARLDRVYVAVNKVLYGVTTESKMQPLAELPRPIRSLIGTAQHTRPRLAGSSDMGGIMMWIHEREAMVEPFASEMSSPVVGFNRGGYVIAVNENCCEVYLTQRFRLTFVARLEANRARPIAVLPGLKHNQFTVLSGNGESCHYEFDE